MRLPRPGRGAAFFTPLRRAGIPVSYTNRDPGSAAHRFARATRCAASGEREFSTPAITSTTSATATSLCGANKSLSARDIRLRSRRTSANGRNSGRTSGGAVASNSNAVFKCPRASPIELIQRRAQLRRLLACEYLFHAAAVTFQQLQRHEQLPPRRIDRQCRDHARKTLGQACVARQMIGCLGLPPHDADAERVQRRRRVVGRRLPAPPCSASDRCRDRTGVHRSGATAARSADRASGSPAAIRRRPDCPRCRHAPRPRSISVHHCRRISPGNGWLTCSRTRDISTLKAYSASSARRLSALTNSVRGVAFEIVGAHQIGAEGRGILVRPRAHGTAISAAATRRRSPIMML